MLVRIEVGIERRPAVPLKPAMNARRKCRDFASGLRRQRTREPRLGEQEGDRLQTAKRWRMPLAPLAPEMWIVVKVQESRDLPNMSRSDFSAQQMPGEMQSGVTEPVRQREPIGFAADPELVETIDVDPFCG